MYKRNMKYTVSILVLLNTLHAYDNDNIAFNTNKNDEDGVTQICKIKDNFNRNEDYLNVSQNENYKRMRKNIILIKEKCGTLCETNLAHVRNVSKGPFYDQIKKIPNCKALWNDSIYDQSSRFKDPIQKLPKYLKQYFSHNGNVNISPFYFDDRETENHTSNAWGKYTLTNQISRST